MNKNQTIVAILALLMFAATWIYVPWNVKFSGGTSSVSYAWIFRPPKEAKLHSWSETNSPVVSHSLSWSELATEWGVLISGLAAGALGAEKKQRQAAPAKLA